MSTRAKGQHRAYAAHYNLKGLSMSPHHTSPRLLSLYNIFSLRTHASAITKQPVAPLLVANVVSVTHLEARMADPSAPDAAPYETNRTTIAQRIHSPHDRQVPADVSGGTCEPRGLVLSTDTAATPRTKDGTLSTAAPATPAPTAHPKLTSASTDTGRRTTHPIECPTEPNSVTPPAHASPRRTDGQRPPRVGEGGRSTARSAGLLIDEVELAGLEARTSWSFALPRLGWHP